MLKEIKHLASHSTIYGLMNILAKGVGFVMIPIYTHYIPPADYGVYELLELIITVVGIFLGAGIVNAVARFYFLYESETERNLVVSSAIYCLSAILLLFIPILFMLGDKIAYLILGSTTYSSLFRLILISFAFNAVLEIPLAYIRFIEKPVLFSIVSLSRLIIQLSLNIYFVVYLELGLRGIIYSGLIASVTFGFLLTASLLKQVGLQWQKSLIWEMLKFGSPIILTNLGMFVFHFADRFYLKRYTSLSDIGIYALGYKMGFLITFLIGQPFAMIWNYWRYDLIKQKDGEQIYGRIFTLFFAVLLFAWLCLSIFSREIIMIMADKKYYQAYQVVPLVAMAYVFREVADYLKGMFFIEKNTKIMGWITIIVAGMALVFYSILIPRFGIRGAAMATVAAFLSLASVYFILVNRLHYINYCTMKNAFSMLMALLLYTLGSISEIHFAPNISIGVKIILLMLFPVFFYYTMLTRQEKDNLQYLFTKIIKKFIAAT